MCNGTGNEVIVGNSNSTSPLSARYGQEGERRENATKVHTLSNSVNLKTFLPASHEVSPETDPVNGTLPEFDLLHQHEPR